MTKELKKFELKSSTRPSKSPLLSTTVAVTKSGEQGYCYVRFSDKMVEFVGKKMPQGLTPSNPAYLIATIGLHTRFTLYAQYATSPLDWPVLLWCGAEAPAWLKFHKVKVNKDGNDVAQKAGSSRGKSGDSEGDPTQGGKTRRCRSGDFPGDADTIGKGKAR